MQNNKIMHKYTQENKASVGNISTPKFQRFILHPGSFWAFELVILIILNDPQKREKKPCIY